MMEYPKIRTFFERNEDFTVDIMRPVSPIIESIKHWHLTEKIDGTNIRISFDGISNVRFDGRTDNAQIPAPLLQFLEKKFTLEKLSSAFDKPIILYGEGYGPKIQNGGYYRSDVSFRLFDVFIDNKWWLSWHNVEDIATKLDIKTAPSLGNWTLNLIIDKVKDGIFSIVQNEESESIHRSISEGIIATTVDPLFFNNGNRVIFKLKTRDFKKQKLN